GVTEGVIVHQEMVLKRKRIQRGGKGPEQQDQPCEVQRRAANKRAHERTEHQAQYGGQQAEAQPAQREQEQRSAESLERVVVNERRMDVPLGGKPMGASAPGVFPGEIKARDDERRAYQKERIDQHANHQNGDFAAPPQPTRANAREHHLFPRRGQCDVPHQNQKHQVRSEEVEVIIKPYSKQRIPYIHRNAIMHVVGPHRAHRPQRNESRNGKTQPPAAPKKVEVQLNTDQTDKSHSLSLSRGARSLSALSAIAIMLVVKTRASAPNTLSHVLLLTPTG